MNSQIYSVGKGFTNSYVIHHNSTIMIDVPFRAKDFFNFQDKVPFDLDEIELIIITHGHSDHINSIKQIAEYTGASVAIHRHDKRGLEGSNIPVQKGVTLWGSLSSLMLNIFIVPFIRTNCIVIDIILGDDGLSLSNYEIPGLVFYTPGHTEGSVSVLLDSGEAFVGDLAMNKIPLCRSPRISIYSHDLEKLIASWKLLLDHGAETIYPGHGEPFSADIISEMIRNLDTN